MNYRNLPPGFYERLKNEPGTRVHIKVTNDKKNINVI